MKLVDGYISEEVRTLWYNVLIEARNTVASDSNMGCRREALLWILDDSYGDVIVNTFRGICVCLLKWDVENVRRGLFKKLRGWGIGERELMAILNFVPLKVMAVNLGGIVEQVEIVFDDNRRVGGKKQRRLLEINGERKFITDWLKDERCKASRSSIEYRLKKGASPEEAVFSPPGTPGRKRHA